MAFYDCLQSLTISTPIRLAFKIQLKLTASEAVPLNSGLPTIPPPSASLLFRLRLHHLDQLDDLGFRDVSKGSEPDLLNSSRSSDDESGSSSDCGDNGDDGSGGRSIRFDWRAVVRHKTRAPMSGDASSRVIYLIIINYKSVTPKAKMKSATY